MVNGGDFVITTERIKVTPESQIQTVGLSALKDALGVTGTIKFLEQFDNGGSGDYTKEKYEHEDVELSIDEIVRMLNN